MEKYKKCKYSDFSGFRDKSYDSGIMELRLSCWEEFHKAVDIFKNKDYIWRGQANKDWPLVASYDRPDQNYNEGVAKCKKPLKSNERRNPHALEEWAKKQHYEGGTPLLDWTKCPYVAAYFAFCNPNSKGDKAIYAINMAVRRLLIKKKRQGEVLSKDRSVEIIDPKEAMKTVRSESQKSKFTSDLYGNDITKSVNKLYERSYEDEEILLARFIILEIFREKCLVFLQSQAITSETLFPDRSDTEKDERL